MKNLLRLSKLALPNPFLRLKVVEEINRRVAAKKAETELAKPFNPKTDLSADASDSFHHQPTAEVRR
jgi:hypothetical protein